MLRVFWRLLLLCFCLFLAACNLMSEAEITAEPTLDLPTIEILEPSNNREIIEGTEFEFDIVARDNGAGVTQIRIWVDDVLIGEASPLDADVVPVFRTRINWLAQGVGRHPVEAIAYRADGTPSDSARISIEVVERE
jgi:hypothetical protein